MAYLTAEQLAATDVTGIQIGKKKSGNGETKDKGPYVSPFADQSILPVVITAQNLKPTKNGFLQLELARSIIKDNGSEVRAGRTWITLPVFSAEKAANLTNDEVAEKTQQFGDMLHAVLRAAMPEQFEVFASIDKSGKEWKYITRSGEVLSGEEKDARAEQIGKDVLAAARKLAMGEMDLTGSRLYMQEVPKKNNPDETSLRCYVELPHG